MSVALQHIDNIPAYIFGAGSSLNIGDAAPLYSSAAAYFSPWFTSVVILVLVAYLLWLNFWAMSGGNHRSVFGFLGLHHGDYSAKLERITPNFTRYSFSAISLGNVAIWLTLAAILGNFGVVGVESYRVVTLGLIIALVAITLYQNLFITLLGRIIGLSEFTSVAYHIKSITMALVAILATPFAICYALSHGALEPLLLFLVVFILIIVACIYVFETFLLFLSKKVSVLHTILYLCAVEIFPVTLIWGFFCR